MGMLAEAGVMGWLRHLGAPGLLVVGVVDSFAIPTFGSMDVLLIILAASNRPMWPVYALACFIGSMLGGYLTYRIARKGGKEALEKRFGKKRLDKVYKAFEKGGFGAVFVPVLLPPPFPTSPFLVAAGALDYPLKKYLVAMAAGRALRYAALGALGAYAGTWIVSLFRAHYKALLLTFSVLAILGGAFAAWYMWKQHKEGKTRELKPRRAA